MIGKDQTIKMTENKINQEELDYRWGLFIRSNTTNLSNEQKDKFIQLRDRLQKEIDKKGYADINNPELKKWWLK